MNHHVAKACTESGGVTSLARKIGVAASVVSQWLSGHRKVPVARVIEIEKATAGAVRCEDLRPDVDWAYLRGTAATPGPVSPDTGAAEEGDWV